MYHVIGSIPNSHLSYPSFVCYLLVSSDTRDITLAETLLQFYSNTCCYQQEGRDGFIDSPNNKQSTMNGMGYDTVCVCVA